MKYTIITKAICVSFSAVAVSLGLAPLAEAQLTTVYSTGFNTPTYVDGPLNSGADTTTPGQDGFLTTSGGATNAISVTNSATNGIVSLATSGQDVRRPFTPVTSGSVFLQADINLSAAQATGDYFLHLSDGGTTNFYSRTYAKLSGAGYVLALGTSSGAVTYGTTILNFGQTYTILDRYDFVSGATNDTGALFVNPTTADGSGNTPYVAATTIGTDATTIAAVGLRQGTAGNAPTLTIDNIVVSSSVPEPSTYVAMVGGLGLLAFVLRSRRTLA